MWIPGELIKSNLLLRLTAISVDSSSRTRPVPEGYPNMSRGLCCRCFSMDPLLRPIRKYSTIYPRSFFNFSILDRTITELLLIWAFPNDPPLVRWFAFTFGSSAVVHWYVIVIGFSLFCTSPSAIVPTFWFFWSGSCPTTLSCSTLGWLIVNWACTVHSRLIVWSLDLRIRYFILTRSHFISFYPYLSKEHW